MRARWWRALLLCFVAGVVTLFAWGQGAIRLDPGAPGARLVGVIDPTSTEGSPPAAARRLRIDDLPPFEPRSAASTTSDDASTATPAGEGASEAAAPASPDAAPPTNPTPEAPGPEAPGPEAPTPEVPNPEAPTPEVPPASGRAAAVALDVNPFAPILGSLPALPTEGSLTIARATAPVIAPILPNPRGTPPVPLPEGVPPTTPNAPEPIERIGGGEPPRQAADAAPAAAAAAAPDTAAEGARRARLGEVAIVAPTLPPPTVRPLGAFEMDGIPIGPMPAAHAAAPTPAPANGEGARALPRWSTASLAFPPTPGMPAVRGPTVMTRRAEPLATRPPNAEPAATAPEASAGAERGAVAPEVPIPRTPGLPLASPAGAGTRVAALTVAPVTRRGGAEATDAAGPSSGAATEVDGEGPAGRAGPPRPTVALPPSASPAVAAVAAASNAEPIAEPIARREVSASPTPPLPAGANELDRFLRDRGYVFTGAVLGPVGVAVFRSDTATAPVVVALGQTLPDSDVVLTDLRSTQAELTLGDARQVLQLELRR